MIEFLIKILLNRKCSKMFQMLSNLLSMDKKFVFSLMDKQGQVKLSQCKVIPKMMSKKVSFQDLSNSFSKWFKIKTRTKQFILNQKLRSDALSFIVIQSKTSFTFQTSARMSTHLNLVSKMLKIKMKFILF